jgi:hypothetical protein
LRDNHTCHVLFCFVASFGSCGKTESDSVEGLSPLEGTWIGDCEKFATGSSGTFGGEYEVSEQNYSGSTLVILHKDFPSAECDPSTILGSYTMSGTFTRHGSNIDWTVTKISSTPSTAAQINDLQTLCPAMIFSIGNETNLSTCESFKSGVTTLFDIYEINGSELYMGKTSEDQDGSTAAKRPSSIDTTRKKVKK